MQTVSATYAKQNFAAILDLSQREPVMIQRHERNIAVMMSAVEYDRIQQLRIQKQRREELTLAKYLDQEEVWSPRRLFL
jgi:prevent-host-death family protein